MAWNESSQTRSLCCIRLVTKKIRTKGECSNHLEGRLILPTFRCWPDAGQTSFGLTKSEPIGRRRGGARVLYSEAQQRLKGSQIAAVVVCESADALGLLFSVSVGDTVPGSGKVVLWGIDETLRIVRPP